MARYVFLTQNTAHAFRMYVTTQANGSSGYAAGVCGEEKGKERGNNNWRRMDQQKRYMPLRKNINRRLQMAWGKHDG